MPAYLDHAATTPVRPEAAAAILPWLTGRFGNPSGSHAVARAARTAIDEARDVLGDVLAVAPGDVVFTGGGTESDNLALRGALAARGAEPGVIVTTPVEHEAVLRGAALSGAEVRLVAVDGDGVVDLDALERVVDGTVSLVSVMLVNNETGVVQPMSDIVSIVRRRGRGALIHTDAVQALPWLDLRTATAGVDLVTVSAHKFGGPQGVGALGLRHGADVLAVTGGGGQERERRPGTHNVAGIVGMASAAAAADAERLVQVQRVGELRDRLVDGLVAAIDGCKETARRPLKAPGHAHVCIEGVESETLLVLLDQAGVYASAGSACASGAMEPSHVLLAMGLGRDEALGSLRLTLGASSTAADVDLALSVAPRAVAQLRGVGSGPSVASGPSAGSGPSARRGPSPLAVASRGR